MAVKSSVKMAGDVFIARGISGQYNLLSVKVKAPASGGPHTVAQIAGMPCSINEVTGVATILLATEEGTAEGLLLHGPALDAVANDAQGADSYSIVQKGEGVVVNTDALPTADSAGTSYTMATLQTALEALGFKYVTEPVKKSTQTT